MLPSETHRNDLTGEILSQNVNWCKVCSQNFSSQRAGDKHRVGNFYPNTRKCISGEEAGLILSVNAYGARIYRLP